MKSLFNWVVVYPLYIPNQPGGELITAHFASYFLNSHFDGVTHVIMFLHFADVSPGIYPVVFRSQCGLLDSLRLFHRELEAR